MPDPELDRLSNIVKAFNEQLGNINWKDADKIRKVIAEEIPSKVAADKAYQNTIHKSDKQNALCIQPLPLFRLPPLPCSPDCSCPQVFAISLTGDRKVSSRSGVAVQCLEQLPLDHPSREIEP
jgi:hypothetical protein